ncbi:hypothetical protein MANES_01G002151v8 [Manihot esculenta]|uniref:Uncharacterized protein n=1 Tax=Manihot esculenta TaxID=3983 RepID=A0ACB7IAH0_MANES|nr:hypothetical protein MANES_01G002151v8 [Manihot esculenta]
MDRSFLGSAHDLSSGPHCRKCLGKLGSLALQEIFLAWVVESELEKIKENLEVIKAVLLDAEQHLSQNPWVGMWQENLKQVLYYGEN